MQDEERQRETDKSSVVVCVHPILIWLTWCRQLGREVKLCTWVSPNRQLRKQWRAAWYSPCCWSCCPSSNRPSLPLFSIPSPSQSQHCLPSEPAEDKRSSLHHSAEAPQVERNSCRRRERLKEIIKCSCSHKHRQEGAGGAVSSTASS